MDLDQLNDVSHIIERLEGLAATGSLAAPQVMTDAGSTLQAGERPDDPSGQRQRRHAVDAVERSTIEKKLVSRTKGA